MKFNDLVAQISGVDGAARLSADRTVKQVLNLRNWLIGAHIVEFEQAGEDRAAYGQVLIQRLAEALIKAGCQGLSASNLKNFRQVALAYPGLDAADLGRRLGLQARVVPASVNRQTSGEPDATSQIRQTSGELLDSLFPSLIRRTIEERLPWRDAGWICRLFATLAFSHLLELSRMDDATRRAFYKGSCPSRQRGSSEIRTCSSSSASSVVWSPARVILSVPSSTIFSISCSSWGATSASSPGNSASLRATATTTSTCCCFIGGCAASLPSISSWGHSSPSTQDSFGSMSTTSLNTLHIQTRVRRWEFFCVPNAMLRSFASRQPVTETYS
jgi:hypothetical protein